MSDASGKLKCIVTGANGYVGSSITKYLRKKGHIVYEFRHLSQKPPVPHNGFIIPYTLEAEIDEFSFENIDVLIHCAYDFRCTKWKDIFRVNVEGSCKLLRAARNHGVRKIIYISTISAFEGCKSLYGRAKMEVEREVLGVGGAVIRPGLIFGEHSGGMVGALSRAVSISKIVPLIGRGNQILYLVNIEDLCKLILQISYGQIDNLCKPIIAAHEQGKTLRSLLEALANGEGAKVTFIPIPWRLIWSLLKMGEMINLNLGFRSDSLISLVNQNPSPCFETAKEIGVHFQEFYA